MTNYEINRGNAKTKEGVPRGGCPLVRGKAPQKPETSEDEK